MRTKNKSGFCALRAAAAIAAAGVLFALAPPASAQDKIISPARAAGGFYIEPMYSTNVVRGDFDGKSFLTDGSELFIMPKFSDGSGLGVSAGWKSAGGTIGIYYYRAAHDVSYYGIPGTATFSAFGLIFTRQFLLRSPVQPFILMTVNFPRIVVADGAVTEETTGDAAFTGGGVDLGAGLMIHVTPRLYVRGGAVFRGLLIGWVKGPEGVTKEIGDLGLDYWQTHFGTVRFAGGTCFALSTGYTF
jgi:hypothetical protein